MGAVRFHVLGTVALSVDSDLVSVKARRLRALLGLLLCTPNDPVRKDLLVDVLWGDAPPDSAAVNLRVYIHQLRQLLGDGSRIVADGGGYRLRVLPGELDADEFVQVADEGQRALASGQVLPAADLLRHALHLWRGPAFGDVADVSTVRQHAVTLEERRLVAVEDRIEADLAIGAHAKVVAELASLAETYPLRERIREQLMLALYRCHRQAEALEVYRDSRAVLVEELGIEPCTQLQRLERAILAGDPELDAPPAPMSPSAIAAPPASASAQVTSQLSADVALDAPPSGSPVPAAVPPVPRQLPADLPSFTGRTAELDRLLATLGNDHRLPAAVVISAIDGMAGIGKTALAVHAAHRLAPNFPDGQLFLDLHGFTQGVSPVSPANALDQMLRALGVPGEDLPHELDARAALYRTRLADRRMLLLLDNAATEAQVQPLLPGAPGCLVLVTSRRRLAGLDDAHPLSLDVLPADDALALFIRIVDAKHPSQPLEEIVQLCGRLPLAIRIAAARLRAHPAWSAAHLAERLRDQHRLGQLEAGQRSVATAIDLSYQQLPADEQRMYRLLGLHPGADIDLYAVTALANTTVQQAGRLLDGLADVHLLHEPIPGRYRFHDLVRAHAADTATRQEPEPDRRAALTRLLDHYAHTAAVAVDALYPYEADQRPSVPPPATPTPALADQAQAAAWLDTERANLLAVASHASHGWPGHTLHLSATLHHHLRTRGYYNDAYTLHSHALHAARAGGHREGELTALWGLGHIHRLQGRYQPAADCYQQALDVARTIDHHSGELDALVGLGTVHHLQGRYAAAADCYQQALDVARATGHHGSELYTLWGLGYVYLVQGRYQAAADCYQQALDVARATRHRGGEVYALWGLGHVHRAQGRYGPASDHYRWALDLACEIGDRNGKFEALQGLGLIRQATGLPDEALSHHQQALDLARDLGQPDDQARAHHGLARAHDALDQHDQARQHLQCALDILTDLGVVQVEEVSTEDVRGFLTDLDRRRSKAARSQEATGPAP